MTKNKISKWSAGLEALCTVQQTNTPSAAIRGACLHLLKACRIESYPVPLKPLLELLGVDFTWSRFGNHWKPGHGTASLRSIKGKLSIFIHEEKAQSNWRRCRFSIAHELIHALLIRLLADSNLISTLDSTEKDLRDLEMLCNLGAAELLMPSNMIRTAVRKEGLSPEGLLNLYDNFLVSKESLTWRIATINSYSCVTKWRKHSRNPTEENRFRVISCYPPYEKNENRPWLPSGATTKHLSSEIIERTNETKEYFLENNLLLKLNEKSWECIGIATYFQNRPVQSKQPYFENFPVPDEAEINNDNDILLFAAERKMVGNDFWGANKSL